MLESANLSVGHDECEGRVGHGSRFSTVAVSARASAAPVSPYLAVVVPVNQATTTVFDVAMTAGADLELPW